MSGGKSLSHLSDEATQQTNTTGVLTPILEVDPEQGNLIKLLMAAAGVPGSAVGLPIYQDLKDGANNALPTDTRYVLRVKRPEDDEPVAVSTAEDNIAAWNGLTVAEQRNEENIDQVKIELKGEVINIRFIDTLRVEVDSSAQIDWTNSELYFERKAVRERPFSLEG